MSALDPVPFNILVVCTANVCRSPAAAALLRTHLAGAQASGRVAVHSAGLRAQPGAGACLRIDELVFGHARHELAEHRSAQLSTAQLRWADLVLTAERAHRSEIISTEPALRGRVFTLTEAARLLAYAPPLDDRLGSPPDSGGLDDLVEEMNDLRAEVHAGPEEEPAGRRRLFSRPVPRHPDDIRDSHVWADARHADTAAALVSVAGVIGHRLYGRTVAAR